MADDEDAVFADDLDDPDAVDADVAEPDVSEPVTPVISRRLRSACLTGHWRC